MTRRIAVWASLGFVVGCAWVLYTFAAAPQQLIMALREPAIKTLLILSCPLAFAFRSFAVPFWAVPLMNAATYAAIGATIEMLRRTLRPHPAV
jgi:hypothetical protein